MLVLPVLLYKGDTLWLVYESCDREDVLHHEACLQLEGTLWCRVPRAALRWRNAEFHSGEKMSQRNRDVMTHKSADDAGMRAHARFWVT